jgi:hypothetical protein
VEILENKEGKLVLKHEPSTIRLYAYTIMGIAIFFVFFTIVKQLPDGGVLIIAIVLGTLAIVLFAATPVIICSFDKEINQVVIEKKYLRKSKIIKRPIDQISQVNLKKIAYKSTRNYVITLDFKDGESIQLNSDNTKKKIAEDVHSLILLFLKSKDE